MALNGTGRKNMLKMMSYLWGRIVNYYSGNLLTITHFQDSVY
jgi:hypothetical protein